MDIDETGTYTFEHPGLDYQLNICLVNIASEITDDDLKIMKYILSGEQGTPKGVLEKITNPLELFEHLKGRLLLSRDNILFLQAMLFHTRRIDLFTKLIEFAKQRGETLHCYPESDSPVNGYKYVKFHVAGRDSGNRSTLEGIRSIASTYMNVPPHFVTVQGIQSTQSYLITFMVPEHCLTALTTLHEAEKHCLLSLGVDFIIINRNTIALQGSNIDENRVPGINLNEQQQYYFKRNAALQRQLQQYQLNDFKERSKHTAECSASLTLLATYLFNIWQNKMMPLVDTVSMQNAHAFFRHGLKTVRNLGYNINVIQSLLDAQSIIERKNNLWQYKLLVQQQQYRIQFLEHKLKYCLDRGINEQVLLKNEHFFLHSIFGIDETISTPKSLVVYASCVWDPEQFIPYLAEASKHLSNQDKTRIKKSFKIDKQDEQVFRQKGIGFLEALFMVESKRSDKHIVDLNQFEQKLITVVNKKEFETQWNTQLQKWALHCQQDPNRFKMKTQQETQTRSKDGDSMTCTQDDSSNKIDSVLDKVDLLTKHVLDIENMIRNPLGRLDMSQKENFGKVGMHSAQAQTMDED